MCGCVAIELLPQSLNPRKYLHNSLHAQIPFNRCLIRCDETRRFLFPSQSSFVMSRHLQQLLLLLPKRKLRMQQFFLRTWTRLYQSSCVSRSSYIYVSTWSNNA
jgi:hypothetical protein